MHWEDVSFGAFVGFLVGFVAMWQVGNLACWLEDRRARRDAEALQSSNASLEELIVRASRTPRSPWDRNVARDEELAFLDRIQRGR